MSMVNWGEGVYICMLTCLCVCPPVHIHACVCVCEPQALLVSNSSDPFFGNPLEPVSPPGIAQLSAVLFLPWRGGHMVEEHLGVTSHPAQAPGDLFAKHSKPTSFTCP